MSKRQRDINGYLLVRDNPISKVGIFPYMGSEIGAPDANRIYHVYRPEEELSNPDTIASFNLLPFIDDHEFLGIDGMAPEKKGVQGTTGENAAFIYPYLTNSLRVYSDYAQDLIGNGKTELSPSYRCEYDFTTGVFDGDKYDAIQRNIRGNHLALVEKGRTGKDVAVLDHYIISNDSAEFITMEFTPEQLKQIRALISEVLAENKPADTEEVVAEEVKDAPEDDAEPVVEAETAVAAVEEAESAIEDVKTALESVVKATEEAAAPTAAPTADAISKQIIRQISERDALAKRLTPHIGVFDSARMLSESDVAKYAVKKLGIKASDGMEVAFLQGYLQAAKPEKIASDSVRPSANTSASKLWSAK